MKSRRNERGLSLAEVLVALTVMVIAGTVALFLYDAARKSFKKGENATEQQQAVRIAFDKVSSDLRLAGFNVNPDGEPDDPDEAVEAAHDTAVVIRADFDAEEPPPAPTDPETSLAGGAHRAVSVGNDEIVAYVLAKPDGSGPDTLRFEADVKDVPRDGVPEQVVIPNVALVQNNPPYTLYRITLNKNPGTWGTGGFVVRTPLLEDVRSLTFGYSGVGGPISGAGGLDTPAARRARSAIRRIDVALNGLTRDPDLGWRDPSDTNPGTRSYRKFLLTGTITPRNIGKKGLQDFGWDFTPPQRPGAPTLVAGHCQGLYILWPPNPPADGVASYRVSYGTAPGQLSVHRTVASTGFYLDGLTNGVTYYVAVEAVDTAGNRSQPSDVRSVRARNDNSPKPPGNVRPSTNRDDGIQLTWNAVTTNDLPEVQGDPSPGTCRDLQGYQIWRGPNDDYRKNPPDPGVIMIADQTIVGPMASPTYLDADVVACRNYWYQVLSWDFCNSNDETGDHYRGRATSTVRPVAPTGVAAFDTGSSTTRVIWEPVVRDTAGHATLIDTYVVYRRDASAGDPGTCADYTEAGSVQGATQFVDNFPPLANRTAFYRVRAKNDCLPPANLSDCSDPAWATCAFTGDVRILKPDKLVVHGTVPIEVRVDGTDAYMLTLEIRNEADGSVQTVPLPGGGPWAYGWAQGTPGRYTIKATVANDQACLSFATTRVTMGR